MLYFKNKYEKFEEILEESKSNNFGLFFESVIFLKKEIHEKKSENSTSISRFSNVFQTTCRYQII